MFFKQDGLKKIHKGEKTQTRRRGKIIYKVGQRYSIRSRWFQRARAQILITRRFRQKLGKISEKDVKKEGYPTHEAFKEAWTQINGSWEPERVVTCYEFKLVRTRDLWRQTASEMLKSTYGVFFGFR